MLKTILISLACSAVTAVATVTYVGRTVISSPFQMDIPFGSAIKVAQDPADVWSWHHDFANVTNPVPATADVLVDMDGNGIMDTEHTWLRVTVTDLEIVSSSIHLGIATISDGTGKRYSVGVGGSTTFGGSMQQTVSHVSLATPIVLPVGGSLQVSVQDLMGTGNFEVNLIGRVVNL